MSVRKRERKRGRNKCVFKSVCVCRQREKEGGNECIRGRRERERGGTVVGA